uniref:Uncharacterized protein n=1 Tax=Strix occidentalis caurina TaxID=311401 RepID=A0A8D0FC08_STROC
MSRRHDSLPSSPSSADATGVHTPSPSSTSSSSGSTGKRRSIFRTPSVSFRSKRGSEQKPDSAGQNVNISNGAQSSLGTVENLSLEELIKSRGRHSVGFGSSRSKKITRSLTEDFEEGRSPQLIRIPVRESQSVPSVQQSRRLLEVKSHAESEPVMADASPPCSAQTTEGMGSSLQPPLLSWDLTAAQAPPEMEIVDSAGHSAGVSPVSRASSCSVESNTSFKTPAANQTEVLLQANELHVNDARHIGEINSGNAHSETFALQRREEPGTLASKAQGLRGGRNESTASRHTRETVPVMEPKIVPCSEPQSCKTQQGYETNPSKGIFSPYREGRFVEKRLRCPSEGTAGGSRLVIKPKDGNTEELNSLRKREQDVLNNLGSCELDEDDVMFDLEFLEEQHHHCSGKSRPSLGVHLATVTEGLLELCSCFTCPVCDNCVHMFELSELSL